MNIRAQLLATALLVGSTLAPAQATVLFSDNFDADHGSSALNFNSLLNWTSSNGTIDYIRSGGYGISCVGGSGGCLDLDGSTGNAGRITSTQVFSLDDELQYYIDLALSGNQRGGSADTVLFGIRNVDTAAELSTVVGPLAANAPFSTISWGFSGLSGNWQLFVEGLGNDNVGAILDNYSLRHDDAIAVPLPGSLSLLGLGLALVAFASTRQRKA